MAKLSKIIQESVLDAEHIRHMPRGPLNQEIHPEELAKNADYGRPGFKRIGAVVQEPHPDELASQADSAKEIAGGMLMNKIKDAISKGKDVGGEVVSAGKSAVKNVVAENPVASGISAGVGGALGALGAGYAAKRAITKKK
jgi:hypothetical protein